MLEDTIHARPTLRGRHLTRTFGDGETRTTALFDVSVDLYPGQIALLMGPSGSGKSTLLAVLSGLLRPDGGRVLAQSFWVGVAGVTLALPTVVLLGELGNEVGAKVQLPWQLLVFSAGLTMAMALLSGLAALRSLRLIEPVNLLR